MKKLLATILLALLFVTTIALAEDALLSAAWSLVPADAVLIGQEQDDGLQEYDFRSDAARYEVIMDRSGAPLALKTEYAGVSGSTEAVLDAAAAQEAALLAAGDGSVMDFALLEQDDRRYVWVVFTVNGAETTEWELNAQTGEIKDAEVYYGLDGVLTPSAAAARLKTEKGDITLTALDLEWDDGKLVYTGDASLDGKRYEFELLASDGLLLEWERD